MRHAKLEKGQIIYSPPGIVIDGMKIINPSAAQLIELGYKPVVFTEPPTPQEGYGVSCAWEENETEIYQVWEEVELPETEQTDGDYLLEKLGL